MKLSIKSICQSYLNIHYFLYFLANSPSIALCFLLVPLAAGFFVWLLSLNTSNKNKYLVMICVFCNSFEYFS